jgi:hypothetical protein
VDAGWCCGAEGMLWAATFIAAYQRLRLLTSNA